MAHCTCGTLLYPSGWEQVPHFPTAVHQHHSNFHLLLWDMSPATEKWRRRENMKLGAKAAEDAPMWTEVNSRARRCHGWGTSSTLAAACREDGGSEVFLQTSHHYASLEFPGSRLMDSLGDLVSGCCKVNHGSNTPGSFLLPCLSEWRGLALEKPCQLHNDTCTHCRTKVCLEKEAKGSL